MNLNNDKFKNVFDDVQKNKLIIQMGLKNNLIYLKEFDKCTFITVNVLKESIKKVECGEWTWSKTDFGNIEKGYWEIKEEKKYIYYDNKLVFVLTKEEEKFIDNLRNKLLNYLKKMNKDLIYIWSIECSNIIHFHFVVNIKYTENLRNLIRKKWSSLIEREFKDPCTDTSQIRDPKKSIEYLIKGPLKLGMSLILKNTLLSYDNLKYFYKWNEFNEQLEYYKYNQLELIAIEKKLEAAFIEKAQFKVKNLHFFNIIKPLGEKVKNKFFSLKDYLEEKIKNKKGNEKYEYIVLLMLFESKDRLFKLFLNIINLCYINSIHNIRRSKSSFCLHLINFLKSYFFNAGFKFEKLEEYSLFKNEKGLQIKEVLKDWFKSQKSISLGFVFFNLLTNSCLNDIFIFREIREDNKDFIIFELKQEIITEFKIEYNEKNVFLYGFSPMVIKPNPWNLKKGWAGNNKKGGFLLNGELFKLSLSKRRIFFNDLKFKRDVKFPSTNFLKCINYLQNIEFELDNNMVHYIDKYKNEIIKNLIGNYSSEESFLKIKEEIKKNKLNFELKEEYEKMISLNSKIDQFNRELNSCKEFLQFEKIYFVYNVDFRGRIYVHSDHLNYQSSKFIRSILRFYKKEKINLNESFWFKVQCSKLYLGNVGKSAEDLEKFFNIFLMEKIKNWDYNDLDFWLNAKEPFLFLASIIEYKRFLKLKDNFYSGFLIWMDATCSGSQLICLLLGLAKYAKDLNLIKSSKSDIPGDYYGKINEEFKDFIKNKISKVTNKKELNKLLLVQKFLNNHDYDILRKVFKKIIMTINYGLTKIGMLEKLKEVILELNLKLENKDLIIYIRDLFFDFIQDISLYKSLDKLEEIAKYLINIDKVLQFSSSSSSGLILNKDVDLYSSQGYWISNKIVLDHSFNLKFKKEDKKEDKKKYKRIRKRMTIRVYDPNKIDKVKYLQAIRANLIHSLDSLWVYSYIWNLISNNLNLNIAVIHDCYATDLKNVEIMNFYLRKTLMDLFKNENLLWNFLHGVLTQVTNFNDIKNLKIEDLLVSKDEQIKLVKDIENSFYLVFP